MNGSSELLLIFFFYKITLFKAIHSAARACCSDLDAHVKKEVWQLFCVLIWKRQRSVFSGRLLPAELQRREIFVLTDSLFSRVYGLSHMFYRLFYGPLSIRKGMNQWKTHMRCAMPSRKTHSGQNTLIKMLDMEGFTAPGMKIWRKVCI